jgi:phosphohistidine phosphatase
MQLYILRHADADTVAAHDDDRHLSEKGLVQAERVARFCEAHEIKPTVILSSPLRRAHETAKIVAEHLQVDVRVVRWLTSGAQPENIVAELNELRGPASMMIVGHEPDLSQLVAFFIGTPHHEAIHLRKGSLTQLTIYEFQSAGARLEFSIPPKLV